MDFNFWNARWEAGQIGFHQEAVNRHLVEHVDRIADPHASGILVPLCGKSRDLTWLGDAFDRVVGVEFVESAVRDYFDERGVEYERDTVDGVPRYRGAGVTLLAGDFHAVTLAHTGPVDRAFDRASMIALPSDVRPRYAAHLLSLLPPGGRILLVTLAYDQSLQAGPPFSVPDDEVRALYGATCDLERLAHAVSDDVPERFAEAGVTTSVWLITKRR